jgi:REP element-mobilizing transposase RayT
MTVSLGFSNRRILADEVGPALAHPRVSVKEAGILGPAIACPGHGYGLQSCHTVDHQPLLGDTSIPGERYMITKCLANPGAGTLVKAGSAELLIEKFFDGMRGDLWKLSAFVVMPDHYHVLIQLGRTKNLSKIMETIGKSSQGIAVNPAFGRLDASHWTRNRVFTLQCNRGFCVRAG